MSKIGIGNNIGLPSSSCMNCKYWKFAQRKNRWAIDVPPEPGRCVAPFCRKAERVNNHRLK